MKGSIVIAGPVAALLFFGTDNTRQHKGTATPVPSKPSLAVFPTQYRPWCAAPATYSWPGTNALADPYPFDGIIHWDDSPFMRLHLGDAYHDAHASSCRAWMNHYHSMCFDHLPNRPGATEEVVAEAASEEVPYQERVLAHLRASLTLPAAAASQVEEAPTARRYNIQGDPLPDAPPSLGRSMLQRQALAAEGMDPGIFVDTPAKVCPAPLVDDHVYQQQLAEKLLHLLDSMVTAKGRQYHAVQQPAVLPAADPTEEHHAE